ncbi:MAG: hypothetical protein F6K61_13175 [Sphaerospermopsis sp. SIO1G1]|nr:hypothetical protein [Sphaerospermopsis sp. SIO1G1]
MYSLRYLLGDRVFEDSNANGIQDVGENGIAGATVNLLADVDGDGVIESGEVVDTTALWILRKLVVKSSPLMQMEMSQLSVFLHLVITVSKL